MCSRQEIFARNIFNQTIRLRYEDMFYCNEIDNTCIYCERDVINMISELERFVLLYIRKAKIVCSKIQISINFTCRYMEVRKIQFLLMSGRFKIIGRPLKFALMNAFYSRYVQNDSCKWEEKG